MRTSTNEEKTQKKLRNTANTARPPAQEDSSKVRALTKNVLSNKRDVLLIKEYVCVFPPKMKGIGWPTHCFKLRGDLDQHTLLINEPTAGESS